MVVPVCQSLDLSNVEWCMMGMLMDLHNNNNVFSPVIADKTSRFVNGIVLVIQKKAPHRNDPYPFLVFHSYVYSQFCMDFYRFCIIQLLEHLRQGYK